jgi:hypothetical protein
MRDDGCWARQCVQKVLMTHATLLRDRHSIHGWKGSEINSLTVSYPRRSLSRSGFTRPICLFISRYWQLVHFLLRSLFRRCAFC